MITLVDGIRQDVLAVTDSTIVRGDGVFEAVRSYGGRVFALDDHLERLARSAAAMGIPLPDDGRIGSWARSVGAEGGEGIVRIIVGRGDAVPGASGERRIVLIHHPVPFTPTTLRIQPWPAPWHPAGRPWELAGVKTTSYAPNVAATRMAAHDGFDDAPLLGPRKIGELAGGTERREAVHACRDQIVTQTHEHIAIDLAIRPDRGNKVREYAAKLHAGH